MIPAAASPSSSSPTISANNQQEAERRTRAERVDYKALHNGRALEQPSRSQSKTKSDTEIMAKGSSASSSSTATRLTQSAQRSALREQKLRADPYVEVLGPVDVLCKRCGAHIKLSMKSTYDPFHWQRHIERCTKRPIGAIKQNAAAKLPEKKKRSTISKNAQVLSEVKSTRGLRPRRKDADTSSTPALTPDREIPVKEEEESPDTEIVSSPPPELTPPPETPQASPAREPDVVLEDYYKRSRRRLTRELSPITPEGWRNWTWSQLKEPVWVVATYPASDSGFGDSPNTMGGSFDSFRISPQPAKSLDRH